MAMDATGKRTRKTAVRPAAWGVLGAAAAILAYSLIQSSGGGIPGWQAANESLQTALSAPAAPEPIASPVPAASPGVTVSPSPTSSAAASAGPPPLDLNTATEADLDALPGIGPSKAKTILVYREAHHGFRSADDLLQVKGIGPKLLEKIRPFVTAAPAREGP